MAVVIAYQSLNSNSSSNHGVKASNSQQFTRDAHNHSAQSSERWALQLPTSSSDAPNVGIHGPAELLRTAESGFMDKGQHSDADFLSMVEGKALQIHQNAIRAFPKACDLLVFGELDSNNPEWSGLSKKAGALLESSTPNKACNCFSVHSPGSGAFTDKIAEGTGWIAVKCSNVIAVFVHVPNSIATNEAATTLFYKNINNEVLGAGKGAIDIVMGDTNQPNDTFTQRVVSTALGASFSDAYPGKTIAPADSYQKEFSGTNAKGTKKYDVAVYNTKSIKKINVIYLSQFASTGTSVAAVTDHMGIAVYLEK